MRITDVAPFIQIALVIWALLLSFYLLLLRRKLLRFTKEGRSVDIIQVLGNLKTFQDLNTKEIEKAKQAIEEQEERGGSHLRKVALIRFNPFEDTGGDQSFVLALLDGNNNGVVLSSLHSRAGTRIYAKEVGVGVPRGHQFSKEEKEAVERAAKSD